MDQAEEKSKVLRERAKALALEPAARAKDTRLMEIIEFQLAHENYAVETAYVWEACPLREITPIPCTPPFVVGLMNLRGRIITVIDIKRFFNLPDKGLTNLNKVIVIADGNICVGVLADSISGARHIGGAQILPPPSTLRGIGLEYLKGISTAGLVILDPERILNDPKLTVYEQVEA